VIDLATNTVVATIPVEESIDPFLIYSPRLYAVLVSPDGSRAYVPAVEYNPLLGPSYIISVIDTATNTVVATIPTPGVNRYLAISPDGTRLYGSDGHPGVGFHVIDTSTNSVVATISTP